MIVIILAAAIGLTMIVLSVRANSRFRQEQKLPMQWMLSRSRPLSSTVIWSAPRIFALSLIPALAILVLVLFAIGSFTLTPRPGQERSEEHTSELQSLMRISYAVFCWKQK